MHMHQLRTECDAHYPDGACLRKLACDIASVGWTQAKSLGLLTAAPAPFNLLSNGETNSGWVAPTQLFPNELLAWKHAANGFTCPAIRGLSLLFDPFVDACLLIEARKAGGPFKTKTKVLVLTDYDSLKNVIGEMAVMIGQDWAAVATGNFFKAKNLGLAGNNFFKALLGKDSISEVQNMGTKEICAAFGSHNLLLWNYFPFLRGGYDCVGMSGLPDPNNCAWIQYCDERLMDFLECVNADRVVFAANKEVKNARKKCVKTMNKIPAQYTYSELDHPSSWRGDARMEEWAKKLLEALTDRL